MARTTLLGASLAKPGQAFTFARTCEVASRCPIAKPCQNLEVGRSFRVVAVRPVHRTECTEYEGGVRAVEVEALPLVASLPEARLRGTLVAWSAPICRFRGCPNWGVCFPSGMEDGRRYEIEAMGETLECPMGYALRRVMVRAGRRSGPDA